MKALLILDIIFIVLIAGCTQTQQPASKLSSDAIRTFNIYWSVSDNACELCKSGGTFTGGGSYCNIIAIKYDAIIDFPQNYNSDTVICTMTYEGKRFPATGYLSMKSQNLGVELTDNIDITRGIQITLCCSILNNEEDSCKTATLPAKCT